MSSSSSSFSSSGVGLFVRELSDPLVFDQVPLGSILTCSSLFDVNFNIPSTYLIQGQRRKLSF